MKAISLWQPWASLVALGEKQFETRSWLTTYRGPIAIHAAKKWNLELARLTKEDYFISQLLKRHGIVRGNVPLGCFVALAELTEIYTTDHVWNLVSYQERILGNYVPGRFVWRLTNVRQIEPVSAIGRQGLWQIGDELAGDELAAVLESKVLKCKTS